MRTLVVEHDPLSTPERVGAHLEKRGATLEPFVVVEDIADPAVTATFPEDPYDLVVLMGSPWSVYEDRVQGWVGPELDFVRSGWPPASPCSDLFRRSDDVCCPRRKGQARRQARIRLDRGRVGHRAHCRGPSVPVPSR